MTQGDRTRTQHVLKRLRPAVEVAGVPLSEGFPVRKIELEVISGEDKGRCFSTDQASIRMGADPMCDFVLQDPTVSRNHAEVRLRGSTLMLADLNSTNGTYVDEVRIDIIPLPSGSLFCLGRTKIRALLTTQTVSIEAVEATRYDNIIGKSPALREIFSILDRVAPSELSVVIEGETGTGKELIARAIHDHSNRAAGPFVVFDCSAFPPSLLESELFGHEKGAFTGAVNRHRGVFERAHGGTLFFDELGELELEFQAKFLRVLETGEVRRVGAEKTGRVDVRVVAATNRNLEHMVQQKAFRSDLFYRMAQVRFLLPPLRHRHEDILLLVEHFLAQQVERTGRRPVLDPEAMEVLQDYAWPGNIRELRNSIEKAVALSHDGLMTAEYFRHELLSSSSSISSNIHDSVMCDSVMYDSVMYELGAGDAQHAEQDDDQERNAAIVSVCTSMQGESGEVIPFKKIKEKVISIFERQYLEFLLERTNMNISKASRQAGIDRRHVYRLLKKHDMHTDD